MSEKNLWIMVGLPGSGKTTYVSQFKNDSNCKIISFDEIQFSITKNNEVHVSEPIIFQEYCKQIQNAINNNFSNIYCDGIHITENMRYRLLHNLDIKNYKIKIIVLNIPIKICLERNEQRIGKAYVQPNMIKNIEHIFKHPSKDHIYYDKIIDIYE